jgi:hypothetical protein
LRYFNVGIVRVRGVRYYRPSSALAQDDTIQHTRIARRTENHKIESGAIQQAGDYFWRRTRADVGNYLFLLRAGGNGNVGSRALMNGK